MTTQPVSFLPHTNPDAVAQRPDTSDQEKFSGPQSREKLSRAWDMGFQRGYRRAVGHFMRLHGCPNCTPGFRTFEPATETHCSIEAPLDAGSVTEDEPGARNQVHATASGAQPEEHVAPESRSLDDRTAKSVSST